MTLEKQVEDCVLSAFEAIPELSSCQVVGSRNVSDIGEINKQDNSKTIVAVSTGFRQNQAFSLSPIDITLAVVIMSRIEEDYRAIEHETVVEKIAELLSNWHFNGVLMSQNLTTPKFVAGELKMDGGSGRSFDQNNRTYTDTINFTIRGSEVHT